MERTPRLLEREDINIKVNQASIRFVMAKHGVTENDFIEHRGWIHEGLKISSKGLDKDGRYYADDRILYGWGRYEKHEAPKDAYPKIFFQIMVAEDLSCTVEEIDRGVYDTAFGLYRQQTD